MNADKMSGKEILDQLENVIAVYKSRSRLDKAYKWQKRVYDHFIDTHEYGLVVAHSMHGIALTLSLRHEYEDAAVWEQKVFDYFDRMNLRRDRDITAFYLCVYLLVAYDENAWRTYYAIIKDAGRLGYNEHLQLVKALGVTRGFLDEAEEHLKVLWDMWETIGPVQLETVQVTSIIAWMFGGREEWVKALYYRELEVRGYTELGLLQNPARLSSMEEIGRLKHRISTAGQ